ncbi:MAG: hypothetical protein ACR2M4_06230 [Actinomycetota bacterium]
MKASEVVDTLQGVISRTKEQGVTQIQIGNLEAFAKELASMVGQSPDGVEAGEAALELHKANLSGWVAERQHVFDRNLEMLRATVLTGQSALKSALLINGGAAVALLAFVGSIWNSANSRAALPLVGCLAPFRLRCFVGRRRVRVHLSLASRLRSRIRQRLKVHRA